MARAKSAAVPLHRVEFVVSFTPRDFSMSAWLFFETDVQHRGRDAKRWKMWLKLELPKALRSLEYPEKWIAKIDYCFDSHENVVKNYEGSYCGFLR